MSIFAGYAKMDGSDMKYGKSKEGQVHEDSMTDSMTDRIPFYGHRRPAATPAEGDLFNAF